jgi:hypothetical protein
MALLVVIVVALLVGAWFLTRSPAPAPLAAPPPPPEELAKLRSLVIDALRSRLTGFEVEPVPDRAAELTAMDVGSERKLTLDVTGIAPGWWGLVQAGKPEEAANLVEAFVQGATGEGAGSDEGLDVESAQAGLALALVPANKLPKAALSRPAGPLAAMLVMRYPNGFDALGAEDLAGLALSEEAAFARAFANLIADVEERVPVEAVGDDDAPKALQVAPGDPLAAAYALVPGLAESLRDRLKTTELRLHVLGTGLLFVAPAGFALEELVDIEGARLVPEALAPETLAWPKPA